MHEVDVVPVPLERMAQALSPERGERLMETARRTSQMLDGLTVWNLNSTSQGGGVAEMLQTLIAYGRAVGLDIRWLVVNGDHEFFATTKRLHNLLHGSPGDGATLDEPERAHYLGVLKRNVDELDGRVRPGDIVLLHDPQTAGMVEPLKDAGAHVVWRCHIGRDIQNDFSERGWAFLRDFVREADAFVFSRRQYAPTWLPGDRIHVIPPSLDPFSTKNAPLSADNVAAAVRQAGIVDTEPDHGSLTFRRRDGSTGAVRVHRDLLLDGRWLPHDARVVMQVSRWDRLKDMKGVLVAFSNSLDQLPDDAHLLLVGPDVSAVDDDPEGADVLAECRELWRRLTANAKARTHLCCLPMDDVDENAHLVNALQRYAMLVTQKSLEEGFGLTVTEPMWKGRPVIASAVGGIRDQIDDGINGRLLDDPNDLSGFSRLMAEVLNDGAQAHNLGTMAHERVQDRYLGDRHLIQYAELFRVLLGATDA